MHRLVVLPTKHERLVTDSTKYDLAQKSESVLSFWGGNASRLADARCSPLAGAQRVQRGPRHRVLRAHRRQPELVVIRSTVVLPQRDTINEPGDPVEVCGDAPHEA